ncbi:OmpA family protein [Kribbella pittospori]|uniref:OmpA family protein n=1 Tax=Kribbella pittospori TaxID=722689 RepID=A0A4R0K8J7_9ACTN|nr:OmpA family protein [Kribbella pittospori]TCC56521.1 OmpA family protein [Kribbella pittospori]
MVIGLLAAIVAVGGAIVAARRDKGVVPPLGGTIVFSAPTANQGAVRIDGVARGMVEQAGAAHQGVRLVRVEGDGAISSRVVDMTPRLDGKPDGEPLKVRERAAEEIARSVSRLEVELNEKSSLVGGEALFAGLSRVRIDTSRPVIVFSAGLDTADPVDFRKLAFDVAPAGLIKDLKAAGELPALTGAVITFVVLAQVGRQEALRRPQVVYRESVWSGLLRAAGASTVKFEYPDAVPSSSRLVAPTVAVPRAPDTPVAVKKTGKTRERTCTLSAATYFAPDKAVLLDRQATLRALGPCARSIGATTQVSVEGHTSSTAKRPNNPVAIKLSTQRAQVVAGLLVELGVARNRIDVKGYGNARQPFPDPSDPRNRCVVVRFNSTR